MTKLEEKLIELGYSIYSSYGYYFKDKNVWVWRYSKYLDGRYELIVDLNKERKIVDCYINSFINFTTQQDIDNLQQAFNQLQEDLEVLREYEN